MKLPVLNKRIVLIVIITLSIAILGLYATYAINSEMTKGTSDDYDYSLSFDIYGNTFRDITVEAGKTKVFELEVTNPYDGTVKYGVAYSMVNPTTLPSGVTIAKLSTSEGDTISLIEANQKKIVSVVVANESTSSVTVSLSVVPGYENGGDLIVSGKTLITSVYNIS